MKRALLLALCGGLIGYGAGFLCNTPQTLPARGGLTIRASEASRNFQYEQTVIATLANMTTTLATMSTTVSQSVTAVQATVTAIQADVTAIQADVRAIQSDVTEVKDGQAEMKQQFARIEARLEKSGWI